jgi:hypothetical protein
MHADLPRFCTVVNVDLTDLYFAYGGDMDLGTLRSRAGDAAVFSPARLVGYRLAFFGHDPIWDGGVETLVKDAQAEAWGVLYRLRPAEWERLDTCMGASLDGAGAYFHYPVEVVTPAGAAQQVRTYRKAVQGEPRQPSTEYMSHLVAAARASTLPSEYQAYLRALPSTPARFPVPKRDPSRRRHLHLL